MTDLIAIGKVLGIPGVVILCWYLLEIRKGEREKVKEAQEAERQRANDKRAAALDRMRIDAENRRTEAMQKGFEALGGKIDSARSDIGEATERIARIEGQMGIKRQTPGVGVPVIREVNRARTNGDR